MTEIHFIDKTDSNHRLPDSDLALEIENLESARHTINVILEIRYKEIVSRLKKGMRINDNESSERHYFKSVA